MRTSYPAWFTAKLYIIRKNKIIGVHFCTPIICKYSLLTTCKPLILLVFLESSVTPLRPSWVWTQFAFRLFSFSWLRCPRFSRHLFCTWQIYPNLRARSGLRFFFIRISSTPHDPLFLPTALSPYNSNENIYLPWSKSSVIRPFLYCFHRNAVDW